MEKLSKISVCDRKIFRLTNSKFKFKYLSIEQIKDAINLLSIEIPLMTGWKLVADWEADSANDKMRIIDDFILKKCVTDWSDLNVNEIMFAFENYAKNIKTYGSPINIILIGQVMDLYIHERNRIIYEANKTITNFIEYKPTEEEVTFSYRSMIEDYYQEFLKGKTSFNFYAVNGIDYLIKDELCSKNIHLDFTDNAINYLSKVYDNKIEKFRLLRNSKELRNYETKKAELIEDGNNEVINISKKMAMLHVFNEAKKAGLKNLYKVTDN